MWPGGAPALNQCAPRSGDEPHADGTNKNAAVCAPRSGDEPLPRLDDLPGTQCAPRSGDELMGAAIIGSYVTCAPRSGDEPTPPRDSTSLRSVRPAQRG